MDRDAPDTWCLYPVQRVAGLEHRFSAPRMAIANPFIRGRLAMYLRIGMVNTVCVLGFFCYCRNPLVTDRPSRWILGTSMVNPQFHLQNPSNRAHEVLFLSDLSGMKCLLTTDPWLCVLAAKPLRFLGGVLLFFSFGDQN